MACLLLMLCLLIGKFANSLISCSMVLFYYPGFLEKVTPIVMGCDDAHVELECEFCMLVWELLNSSLPIGLDNSMIETPYLGGRLDVNHLESLPLRYLYQVGSPFCASLHHMGLLL